MSLYIHESDSDKRLDGVPQSVLDDIAQAKQRINALQESINSLNESIAQKEAQIAALQQKDTDLTSVLDGKLNADRVTRATNITEAGHVVDGRELNQSIAGTIANRMAHLLEFEDITSQCSVINEVTRFRVCKAKNGRLVFGFMESHKGNGTGSSEIGIVLPFNTGHNNKYVGCGMSVKFVFGVSNENQVPCNVVVSGNKIMFQTFTSTLEYTTHSANFMFSY